MLVAPLIGRELCVCVCVRLCGACVRVCVCVCVCVLGQRKRKDIQMLFVQLFSQFIVINKYIYSLIGHKLPNKTLAPLLSPWKLSPHLSLSPHPPTLPPSHKQASK